MKTVLKTGTVEIPDKVKVEIVSRVITVTGPRGKVTKNLKAYKCMGDYQEKVYGPRHGTYETRQVPVATGGLRGAWISTSERGEQANAGGKSACRD